MATAQKPAGDDGGTEPEPRDPDRDAGPTAPQAPSISEEELFDVLSNRRRRYAVQLLKREDGGLELGDMAERIAAWETDSEVPDVSSDERKRVYTALRQSHLPKMDDAGIVAFDADRGTIEPTPALEEVDVYLEVVRGDELPWSEYYLGLAAVAAALVAALWIDAWPFVLLGDLAWTAIIVGVFAVSAAIHRFTDRSIGVERD